uniref:Metallo-beta-lactamase domain-containing protein n=1 Tax=Plectus sambesii TaxID=2011161 RepID=A0A914WXD6_9BILA
MVVTTHGHPDHFGQVSLFPNARHFFDAFEITGNTFIPNGLNDNETIKLTPNVELWSTPGHTPQDTSIVVRNVPCCGTISIVGDLIYREADVLNSTMWELGAWSVAVGMPNRYRIICVSDHIVPGHGPMFRVTDAMRTLAQCPTTTSPNGNGIVPPISTIPPPEPITGEPGSGIGNGIVTDFPPLSPDTLPTPPPFDPNQPLPTLLPFLPDQPIPTDPLPTDTMPTDPTPTDVFPPMPVSPTDQLPPDQLPQQPLDQDPLQPPMQTFPPFPSPSETQAPTYVQYQQPLYQQPPMVQVQYQQPSQAQPRHWLGK